MPLGQRFAEHDGGKDDRRHEYQRNRAPGGRKRSDFQCCVQEYHSQILRHADNDDQNEQIRRERGKLRRTADSEQNHAADRTERRVLNGCDIPISGSDFMPDTS